MNFMHKQTNAQTHKRTHAFNFTKMIGCMQMGMMRLSDWVSAVNAVRDPNAMCNNPVIFPYCLMIGN